MKYYSRVLDMCNSKYVCCYLSESKLNGIVTFDLTVDKSTGSTEWYTEVGYGELLKSDLKFNKVFENTKIKEWKF